MKVTFHIPMKIQMLGVEIREHRYIEAAALQSTDLKPVGRGFHDAGLAAVFYHESQVPLNIATFGRGPFRVRFSNSVAFDDASQKTGLYLLRLKDAAQNICRSTLSVGARHPDHQKFRGRLLIDEGRQFPHNFPGRFDKEDGKIGIYMTFANESHGAGGF